MTTFHPAWLPMYMHPTYKTVEFPYVVTVPEDIAEFLQAIPGCGDVTMRPVGPRKTEMTLHAEALDSLRAIDSEHDGHFDGVARRVAMPSYPSENMTVWGEIWIAGDPYPVTGGPMVMIDRPGTVIAL